MVMAADNNGYTVLATAASSGTIATFYLVVAAVMEELDSTEVRLS